MTINQTQTIEEIFKEVIIGKRKRFPRLTWSKDNRGYDNFNRCLRYLAKTKKLNRKQIVDIDHEFIKTHKLRGGLVMLYNDNIKPAIINAFPEFEFKEWEFFRYSKDKNLAKIALREVVNYKGLTRDMFLEDRSELYKDKDIYRILDWAIKNNIKITTLIKESLPEFNFTDQELSQRINRERIRNEIRETFENELKWSIEDIENKMTREIAVEYFSEGYAEYRNLLKMVRSVYPEIKVLKAVKAPLSQEIKDCILKDIENGHKTKDILNRYGISRTTLLRMKNQHF